jgi:hypothetical protein
LIRKGEEDEEVKAAASFLAETAIYHINHHDILCLCGLAYSELIAGRKKLILSKNTDTFLRQSVENFNQKLYLPSKDSFLENF